MAQHTGCFRQRSSSAIVTVTSAHPLFPSMYISSQNQNPCLTVLSHNPWQSELDDPGSLLCFLILSCPMSSVTLSMSSVTHTVLCLQSHCPCPHSHCPYPHSHTVHVLSYILHVLTITVHVLSHTVHVLTDTLPHVLRATSFGFQLFIVSRARTSIFNSLRFCTLKNNLALLCLHDQRTKQDPLTPST